MGSIIICKSNKSEKGHIIGGILATVKDEVKWDRGESMH